MKKQTRTGRKWLVRVALAGLAFGVVYLVVTSLQTYLLFKRVERTVHFTLTDEHAATDLFLPPGVEPRLVAYRIRNAGGQTMATPRLLINDAPRWWSLDEIVESCGGPEAEPGRLAACFFDLLRNNLKHAEDYMFIKDTRGEEVLRALNDLGFSQCGPSSNYLSQLAKHAGMSARSREINGEHVVTELYWDGQWHMFDVDRNVFPVGADYREVLSLDTLREKPALYPLAPGHFWYYYYARNKRLLTDDVTTHKMRNYAWTTLPTKNTPFPNRAELSVTCAYDSALHGSSIALVVPWQGKDLWQLTAPYPLLRVRWETSQPVSIADADNGIDVQVEPGREASVEFGESDKLWLAPRRHLKMRLLAETQPLDINLIAEMRTATQSLPTVREGYNRLEVDSASEHWNVELELVLSVRVGRDWVEPESE